MTDVHCCKYLLNKSTALGDKSYHNCNCSICCIKLFPFSSLTNDDLKTLWLPQKPKTFNTSINNSNSTQYCTLETFSTNTEKASNFTILQINARSLIKNFEKIENLLITTKFSPDIIIISETKLKPEIQLPHTLPNYSFICTNSPTNAGGVGIFIKSSYTFTQTSHFNLNANFCEDIWIEILMLNSKKIIIGAIYRHPSYKINPFLNNIESTIDKLNKNNLNYFICGDINLDLLKYSKADIANYENTLLSYGCKQYIKNATHLVNELPSTLLDHFYSNLETANITPYILLDDISDHLPVATVIKNFKPIIKQTTSYKRDTKNFNAEEFLIDLNEQMYSSTTSAMITPKIFSKPLMTCLTLF